MYIFFMYIQIKYFYLKKINVKKQPNVNRAKNKCKLMAIYALVANNPIISIISNNTGYFSLVLKVQC